MSGNWFNPKHFTTKMFLGPSGYFPWSYGRCYAVLRHRFRGASDRFLGPTGAFRGATGPSRSRKPLHFTWFYGLSSGSLTSSYGSQALFFYAVLRQFVTRNYGRKARSYADLRQGRLLGTTGMYRRGQQRVETGARQKLAAEDHGFDLPGGRDFGEGVGAKQDEVGALARGDRALRG